MTGAAVRPIAPANSIRASDFRVCQKGESLQGFVVLHLPSRMALYDCTFHQRADGSRWIGLPSSSYTDQAGKKQWKRLVDFDDKVAKKKFQELALLAVDDLLASAPEGDAA
jgi:hypothetical protein